jgi:Bacterial Ig-like domain (group 2)/Putative Ig domain
MSSRYVKSLGLGIWVGCAPLLCAARARVFWIGFLLSVLSACGGGGDGSSGAPTQSTTAPFDLSYPTAPTFSVGAMIAPLTPTVLGSVTSYSVSPALPAGLSLNTSSGVISGTPATFADRASYTVNATNAGGSTTATVSIEVVEVGTGSAPSDLKYPTAPVFVLGTAITPLTPTVIGTVASYSVSPALPAGLGLNTKTGVISGIPTAASAKAVYSVRASNSGGSTTATVSIEVTAAAPAYTAKSGVAQKGPLIQGSTVTAQQLDASLSPTGQQFSYQILTKFGTFSPTSTFTSQYLGLIATGYYFDELADALSSGPITLNAYSDLSADSVLNVNLLTTLEYQRIQNLITQSNMTFAAARAQAETEVLAALNIPAGSYGSFDSLNLTGSSDGDYILAAISSLFVYGNSAGPLSALIASFQSDIGANGAITNPATTGALVAAAKGINPTTVAANLTQYYASQKVIFTATNISDWIAQSGDGVIGRDAFLVPDATPSTVLTLPSYVVSQFAGLPVSLTVGQLTVNGTAVAGTVSFNKSDVVAVSPGVGKFPNGVLTCYLVTGKTNLARVSFVSGLVSIALTPSMPSVPLGVTQQFTATGTFSDASTANLTSSVNWTSGTPAVASVNASSGLANALTEGSTVITATSGTVSGSTTLTVTPAGLQSIAITPNPITMGPGSTQQLTATGTYSDGTTQNVTTAAKWTSDTPSVATIGPSTGLATGVSVGSATISATLGSLTATAPLSVVTTGAAPSYSFSEFDVPGSCTSSCTTSVGGINDSGVVSGEYYVGVTGYGFEFNGATYSSYSAPGADSTAFAGINNLGQVVGSEFSYSTNTGSVFLYAGGTYQQLNLPSSVQATAFAINDNGDIVGWSYSTFQSPASGFAIVNAQYIPMNYPGAASTTPYGITNNGTIIGDFQATPSTPEESFIYQNGTYTDLGLCCVRGINQAGEIVGFDPNSSTSMFLLANGQKTTIQVPGATNFVIPVGINDVGQIAGTYADATGEHGFIATPVTTPAERLGAAAGAEKKAPPVTKAAPGAKGRRPTSS